MDGLLRSLDALRQPLLLLDMGARGWPILHANEAWTKSMGGFPRRLFTSWKLCRERSWLCFRCCLYTLETLPMAVVVVFSVLTLPCRSSANRNLGCVFGVDFAF